MMNRYSELSMADFIAIGHKTNYTPHYVRKVLRGYVKITKRNKVIQEEADKRLNNL